MKIKDLLIWILLIIIVMGAYVFYRDYRDKKAAAPLKESASVVIAHKIMPQKVTLTKSYIGYVMPIQSVSVLPYISGFIDQVLVKGGQDVTAGQTLFILRQGEYQAQEDAAFAKVLETNATFENAKIFYERMSKAGPKAVSKTDLDNAKASFLSAQAAVSAAIAQYELTKINYDYTIVKATISGFVGDIQITPGDYVSPAGQALANIIQYTPIRVVFSIPDKDYLIAKTNTKGAPFQEWTMRLKLADGTYYADKGVVQFFNNEVTPETSSVNVYADFNNPDKVLVANAYVNVMFEREVEAALLVPQKAVTLDPKGNFTYIVVNGVLKRAPVDVGDTVGTAYVILKGLSAGDIVVTSPVNPRQIDKPVQVKQDAGS